MRDWLHVASNENVLGRVLDATPHEIGVDVAHNRIAYGEILERDPVVLGMLKTAIFRTVRDAVADKSRAPWTR